MIEGFPPLKPGRTVALDPGNTETGWVLGERDESVMGHVRLHGCGTAPNLVLRRWLHSYHEQHKCCQLVLECPKPRGMPTAAEEMETLIEIGRTLQLWRGPWSYAFRQVVKIHATGSPKATDSNVRQALIDRFGGDSVAIGGKKCQACKGQSRVSEKREATCTVCQGVGQVEGVRGMKKCSECKGRGSNTARVSVKCQRCQASGWEAPPGVLHDFSSHAWAALAVLCWWVDAGKVQQQIAGKQPVKQKIA